MAPPPGTVIATVVAVWLATAAWETVRPGSPAITTGQYVARFHTAAVIRMACSERRSEPMMAQTLPKEANRGSTPTSTPPMTAAENMACPTRRAVLSACLPEPDLSS